MYWKHNVAASFAYFKIIKNWVLTVLYDFTQPSPYSTLSLSTFNFTIIDIQPPQFHSSTPLSLSTFNFRQPSPHHHKIRPGHHHRLRRQRRL
ncbi:hypothetical protein HanIR_Chr08g0369311 [Helianthus annuus]|nr:hypothetical protein HanIR_Chr08g0369311 [Helianthus annuus]